VQRFCCFEFVTLKSSTLLRPRVSHFSHFSWAQYPGSVQGQGRPGPGPGAG
jgi:hypothetical protein